MGLPIITHSVTEGCISIELVSSIEISMSCLVVGEIPTYKRLAILYLSCPQLWDRVAVEHGLQGQNMTACLSTFSKSWTEEWITKRRRLQDHLCTKQYGRIMNCSKLHILVSSKQHEMKRFKVGIPSSTT